MHEELLEHLKLDTDETKLLFILNGEYPLYWERAVNGVYDKHVDLVEISFGYPHIPDTLEIEFERQPNETFKIINLSKHLFFPKVSLDILKAGEECDYRGPEVMSQIDNIKKMIMDKSMILESFEHTLQRAILGTKYKKNQKELEKTIRLLLNSIGVKTKELNDFYNKLGNGFNKNEKEG